MSGCFDEFISVTSNNLKGLVEIFLRVEGIDRCTSNIVKLRFRHNTNNIH